MKRLVVVVGLVIFLASGAVLGESKDCGCPNQAAVSRVEALQAKCQDITPGELPEPEAQTTEAMEWQCIVWWTKECVHYDTRNCDYCYLPCLAGCWPTCALITNFWWGFACSAGCSVICMACPNCTYCDEWEYTGHESCGWVFIE
jgi:hypothetical protein